MEDIGEEIAKSKCLRPVSHTFSSVSTNCSWIADSSQCNLEGDDEATSDAYLTACAELFTTDATEFKILPCSNLNSSCGSQAATSYIEASYHTAAGEQTTVVVSLFSTHLVLSLLNFVLVLPSSAMQQLADLVNVLNSESLGGKFVVKPRGNQLYVSYHIQLHYSNPSAAASTLRYNYNIGKEHYESVVETVFKPFMLRFQPSSRLIQLAWMTRQVLAQLDLKNFNEKTTDTETLFMFSLSDLIKGKNIRVVIGVSLESLRVMVVHHQTAEQLESDLGQSVRSYLEQVNSKVHAQFIVNDSGLVYLEHRIDRMLIKNYKDCIKVMLKNNLMCYKAMLGDGALPKEHEKSEGA